MVHKVFWSWRLMAIAEAIGRKCGSSHISHAKLPNVGRECIKVIFWWGTSVLGAVWGEISRVWYERFSGAGGS